jgi:hypothetical protein
VVRVNESVTSLRQLRTIGRLQQTHCPPSSSFRNLNIYLSLLFRCFTDGVLLDVQLASGVCVNVVMNYGATLVIGAVGFRFHGR